VGADVEKGVIRAAVVPDDERLAEDVNRFEVAVVGRFVRDGNTVPGGLKKEF
jgi:hypothetical protein